MCDGSPHTWLEVPLVWVGHLPSDQYAFMATTQDIRTLMRSLIKSMLPTVYMTARILINYSHNPQNGYKKCGPSHWEFLV